METYIKIKDKKHAEKVIKRLVRIGYNEYAPFFSVPISQVKYFMEHMNV